MTDWHLSTVKQALRLEAYHALALSHWAMLSSFFSLFLSRIDSYREEKNNRQEDEGMMARARRSARLANLSAASARVQVTKASAKASNKVARGKSDAGERELKPKSRSISKSKAKTKGKGSATSGGGPSRLHEQEKWSLGYKLVAGVDEAGRGPLVGPVVAAACILHQDIELVGINDSKKMSEQQRDQCYDILVNSPSAVSFAWHAIDATTIDEINILQATMKAMETAVAKLQVKPDFVLIDGNRIPKNMNPGMFRINTSFLCPIPIG